ncbi:MAG: tetratricopeptide repeat protein [Agarilytica sp.]
MKIEKISKSFLTGICVTCISFISSVVLEVTSGGAAPSFIASAEAQSAKKKKTRRLPGISESVMKKLAVVTELTNPDTEKNPNAKPNFQAALKELAKMEKTCEKKCNEYEKAQVYRFYAFAYYSMDNYPKAIGAYKQVYAKTPNIPIAVELDALNALSQLHYAQEDYKGALKYLDLWMKLSTIVGADKIFLRGTIYYAMDNKKLASRDVDDAIARLESKGKVAKEQWYNLQLALYLEREKYKEGMPILEKLVKHYPKVKWWRQLSNIYGQLGSESKQLGSLDAVDVMGGLSKQQEIVNTAYLYLGDDVPYKAARILEKGMKDKKVERNVKYLKVLANAWRAAREPRKSIEVVKQAVKAAEREDKKNKNKKKYKPEQGNMYAELVTLYGDIDDSKSAVEAGKNALRVGKLKKPCEVHTNMGIAYVELQQFKSAVSSFEEARKDKQCRAFVNNWLKFAKNEQRQQAALKDSM